MRVALQFKGPLAKKFQGKTIDIEVENNATLLDLFTMVIEREEAVREQWSTPEHIDRDALVLCNETDIGITGGLATKLNEGDAVVVLPLIHGG
jgi:molybdopterin converting factor small subunit